MQRLLHTGHRNKEKTSGSLRRKGKSLQNGETSSRRVNGEGDEEAHHQGLQSPPPQSTWSSLSEDEHRVSIPTAFLEHQPSPSTLSNQEEARPEDSSFRANDAVERSSTLIQRRLQERQGAARRRGHRSSSISIFRFPPNLGGKNQNVYQPELVSLGPYHRGKDHLLEFEDHKWSFLEKFLSRRVTATLDDYLVELKYQEEAARDCYSEIVEMSSSDFIEMMLLDGCFILELTRHLNHCEDDFDEGDPIFSRPWLIPVLIRDLLKLENQLPYFVLHSLFTMSRLGTDEGSKMNHLPILALKVFDLAFPRPSEILNYYAQWEGKHLLDLFHTSLIPSNHVIYFSDLEQYHPSEQSIQCVTQLRPAGIRFKSSKADSFLDIKFQNSVLEIPSITVNDFTSTILINCIALEQCEQHRSKYFTAYVSFMSCLINQPRDAAFLCSDGIITRFSQDDKYVADLFNNLGKNVEFNIRDCYLSKLFKEVESYYSSYWATMRRTYFSSPWSFISVFSAFILLVLITDSDVCSSSGV
ncbi:hypothetical protein Tsubulata_009019 [Turnera subulata]|uniref:Uncharacterized protein n=1 Tax=Turnera subulata TaxID=218843 RepID=A0A9Q0FK37_9ROSI|nr:hypothetical protein Tsubulata_009019 [Turnera subulata]